MIVLTIIVNPRAVLFVCDFDHTAHHHMMIEQERKLPSRSAEGSRPVDSPAPRSGSDQSTGCEPTETRVALCGVHVDRDRRRIFNFPSGL
jgi:hypothetical protein